MANRILCAERQCDGNCTHGSFGIYSGESDHCEVPTDEKGNMFIVHRGSRCRHTDESYQRGLEIMKQRPTRKEPVVDSIH